MLKLNFGDKAILFWMLITQKHMREWVVALLPNFLHYSWDRYYVTFRRICTHILTTKEHSDSFLQFLMHTPYLTIDYCTTCNPKEAQLVPFVCKLWGSKSPALFDYLMLTIRVEDLAWCRMSIGCRQGRRSKVRPPSAGPPASSALLSRTSSPLPRWRRLGSRGSRSVPW